MKKQIISAFLLLVCSCLQPLVAQQKRLLGDPVDMSLDFKDFHNTFFFADKLASFDPATAKGKISWKRSSLYTRQAFNATTILPQDLKMLDFPGDAVGWRKLGPEFPGRGSNLFCIGPFGIIETGFVPSFLLHAGIVNFA